MDMDEFEAHLVLKVCIIHVFSTPPDSEVSSTSGRARASRGHSMACYSLVNHNIVL